MIGSIRYQCAALLCATATVIGIHPFSAAELHGQKSTQMDLSKDQIDKTRRLDPRKRFFVILNPFGCGACMEFTINYLMHMNVGNTLVITTDEICRSHLARLKFNRDLKIKIVSVDWLRDFKDFGNPIIVTPKGTLLNNVPSREFESQVDSIFRHR